MSKLRKHGIEMPLKGLDRSRRRLGGRLAVGDEFAVTAIAHPLLGGLVPEIAAGRPGHSSKAPSEG